MHILTLFPWLETPILQIALWVWLAVPLVLFGSILLARLIMRGGMWLLGKAFAKARQKERFNHLVLPLARPLAWVLASILFNLSNNFLPIPKDDARLLGYTEVLFSVWALTWVVLNYLHLALDGLQRRLNKQGRSAAAAVVPLFRKILKTIVVLLAILFTLQNMGYDISAILAAAGVGGVAIALASQKSVESLFGGVMIALDQPIRVGDYGKFGTLEGTVEDIGLRSCLIRTPAHSLVSIPNAKLADMVIENLSARKKYFFKHHLPLRLDTPQPTLLAVLEAMRGLLQTTPSVEHSDARAQLIGLSDSAFTIEITAYIKAKNLGVFMDEQEKLLLALLELVAKARAELAYPTQRVVA